MSSVMRRMKDMTAAALNDRLDKAEDPVKLIDQFLYQQKEQIGQAERLYQQMINHATFLRGQYTEAELMMNKREEQAMLALKAGEEHIAKIALQEKVLQEEKTNQYKELYEQSKDSILEVEEQLSQLRAEYQEVLSKRQFYAARLESIRLQRQMNERLRSQSNIGNAFHRLEDRVHDMEIESKCMSEVRKVGQELAHAGVSVQQTIERELEGLKKKLEREGWMNR
jgi:phage shock protein A